MSRTFATGIVFSAVLIAVAVVAPSTATAQRSKPTTSPDTALRALAAARSDVRWSTDNVQMADLDCDGRPDAAALGRSDHNVFVGVVRSGAKPEILQFAIDAGQQAAICAEPAKLRLDTLDFDPSAEIGSLVGFRRSRVCKGLLLSGGECDPVHIFWNHNDRQFSWWRL